LAGLCYNGAAVEQSEERGETRLNASEGHNESVATTRNESGRDTAAAVVDVARYCPVCSQRLESRRCKLICSVCGYYMSCADYY